MRKENLLVDNRDLQIFFIFLAIEFTTLIIFLTKKQYTYVTEILLIIFLYSSIFFIESMYNFKIEYYIKVLTSITFVSHNLFGELLGLYEGVVFDKFLHLFGTFALTLLLFSLLKFSFLKFKFNNRIFLFIFVTLLGISIGTLFETLEFFLDQIFGQHNQHSLLDTNLDLIADTVGALLAGYWMYYRSK